MKWPIMPGLPSSSSQVANNARLQTGLSTADSLITGVHFKFLEAEALLYSRSFFCPYSLKHIDSYKSFRFYKHCSCVNLTLRDENVMGKMI